MQIPINSLKKIVFKMFDINDGRKGVFSYNTYFYLNMYILDNFQFTVFKIRNQTLYKNIFLTSNILRQKSNDLQNPTSADFGYSKL